MDKICMIIPSTSNERNWNNFDDTYLNNILFKNIPDNIELFIGYDYDDILYSKPENRPDKINNNNINWISFYKFEKGNVCAIWNELAKISLSKGYEYMFICGDDILLPEDKEWINTFIYKLKENNNVGYTAGYSNNNNIPTQFLLHKTHVNIYGWIFPPQIKNWFCDDFLYGLYGDRFGNWLKEYNLFNCGGKPRYVPRNNDKNLCDILVKRHRKDLYKYINKNKYLN